MTDDPRALRPADFPHHRDMPIRWLDVDRYGHVNNAVHYLLMDTVVNDWIAAATGMPAHELPAIGLVVETQCQYFREIEPGSVVDVGLALAKLGDSSIRYRLGFFIDDGEPAAVGRFVHVYVDRDSRRPTTVPQALRTASEEIE